MIKVLKVAGRIVKMAAAAVGAGGWAIGLLDPATAGLIGGCAYFLGDGIVLAGDIIDGSSGKSVGWISDPATPRFQ